MKSRFIFLGFICLTQVLTAQNWQKLGDGPNFAPRSIYGDTDAHLLYVGGQFHLSGPINYRSIAVWDGANWSSVGGGLTSGTAVFCVTKYKEDIYICGSFDVVGGIYCNGLAKWNGQAWDSVTNQFHFGSTSVIPTFLLPKDTFLYVFGGFDSIGTIKAEGVAKYNGNTWSNVGDFSGTYPGGAQFDPDGLQCAAWYNGELYVGEEYYDSAGVLQRIAKYDGNIWSNVANGIPDAGGNVDRMAVYNGELYVGGSFTKANGSPGDNIAKWNGTSWSEVGAGMAGEYFSPYGQVHDLYVYNNELYAAGVFYFAGGVPAQYIAKWNGSQWCGFGDTFSDNIVGAIGSLDGNLYIGGGFNYINDDTIRNMAEWIGGNYVDTCSAPVGISSFNQINFNFSIYPNPVTSQLEIILPENYQTQQLKIINTLGQQITRQQFSSTERSPSDNQISIDVSDLSPGVYFLELQNEKEKVVKKFVRQ